MTASRISNTDLLGLYNLLEAHFGFLDWWPGDTRLEIMVGAVLAQQTSWKNVESVISNLKSSGSLDLDTIASMPLPKLERLVHPSGYFRQKARRLRGICASIKRDYGSLDALLSMETQKLRESLLGMDGIGEETCDSIILYAAEKPIFVVDAYTKRIMSRIFLTDPDITYGALQLLFHKCMPPNVRLFKDFHAQFVELGKSYCRKSNPICSKCPANLVCRFAPALRSSGASSTMYRAPSL